MANGCGCDGVGIVCAADCDGWDYYCGVVAGSVAASAMAGWRFTVYDGSSLGRSRSRLAAEAAGAARSAKVAAGFEYDRDEELMMLGRRRVDGRDWFWCWRALLVSCAGRSGGIRIKICRGIRMKPPWPRSTVLLPHAGSIADFVSGEQLHSVQRRAGTDSTAIGAVGGEIAAAGDRSVHRFWRDTSGNLGDVQRAAIDPAGELGLRRFPGPQRIAASGGRG